MPKVHTRVASTYYR